MSSPTRCPFSAALFAASSLLFVTSMLKDKKSGSDRNVEKDVEKGAQKESKYQVVFILGGPGSGKGTQCERLCLDLRSWSHLSAGDLLRAERKKDDSELANVINSNIAAGKIVPSEITVRLLRNAMEEEKQRSGTTKFLIDGFPRSEGNVTSWKEVMDGVATLEFAVFLDCPEDTMTSRLLERGQTSGRNDDKLDVIRKRFQTYRDESMPIVEMYTKEGKCRSIAADRSIDEVYADMKSLFKDL
mmetsp:Transcript_33141/g.48588  ORF Transcript_33141/g.48588 Transcript_33141/m.48588 type:complete len:244 (+) Transcript_33141:3-734(+)